MKKMELPTCSIILIICQFSKETLKLTILNYFSLNIVLFHDFFKETWPRHIDPKVPSYGGALKVFVSSEFHLTSLIYPLQILVSLVTNQLAYLGGPFLYIWSYKLICVEQLWHSYLLHHIHVHCISYTYDVSVCRQNAPYRITHCM